MEGIPGTFIANQYVNLKPGKVIENTLISFDKGGSWSLLDVPPEMKSSCPDQSVSQFS